jgi:hypothetical protein
MALPDPRQHAPRLSKDGLGWVFRPAEAPVSFGFSRIVERSSEITAELLVQAIGGSGAPAHVLRRRVNLLGSRTPADLAKDLDLSTNGAGWPWRSIVESAFASVIEAHREGEREQLLGGKRVAPPPPKHLIDGLLIANVANTWFGPGGTGKSTAAVAACVAHVLGYQMAGRHTEQGVALYLDWEDEEEAFERILWEVSRGYELEESARVYWRRMKAPLAGDVPFVSSLIDRLGVTLLVIDSATRAMGAAGDHGTYESTAVSFAEAIRALGKVTTLIVDHVDGAAVKEGGVSKKAYGSIHKLNFVRNAWSLTPDDEAGGQTVGWTHAKVNHGPKLPQFGIQYQRDPVMGSLELVPVDGASVPSIAATMSIASRAAALLSDRGVLSVKDITDELMGSTERKDTETVRKALRRAEGRLFRSYSDGTWSLRNWTPAAPKARREDAPDLRIVEDEQPDELPF